MRPKFLLALTRMSQQRSGPHLSSAQSRQKVSPVGRALSRVRGSHAAKSRRLDNDERSAISRSKVPTLGSRLTQLRTLERQAAPPTVGLGGIVTPKQRQFGCLELSQFKEEGSNVIKRGQGTAPARHGEREVGNEVVRCVLALVTTGRCDCVNESLVNVF